MRTDYDLFIGGRFVSEKGQRRFPAVNPFNQEEWASIPQASDAQVAEAIAAARAAFETVWSRTNGAERGRLLNRLADLLAADADRMGTLESTDNGKIIRETKSQMHFAARAYRFFAGYADKLWGLQIPLDQRDVLDYTVREPIGVAVLIIPWNSPVSILSNKVAPALAAGNCVVIKPSEHASATTLEFAKFVEQAGFPPGVVNVVTGDGAVGRALMNNGRIDRVSFTGSPHVARTVAAEAGRLLVPTTLELGGKSPNIIFDDGDLPKAIVGALAGIFGATGQTCVAGSRLLVQRRVYAEVAEKLAQRAKTIRLGDPLDSATEMGTAANEPQFRRILAAIDSGKAEGAQLLTGGGPASGAELSKGFFIEPTIFVEVRNDMAIAREEIFGPVLGIIPFDTEEEAIQIANNSNYGLASGIWTSSVQRAMRVTRALKSGTVWVNTYRVMAAQAPGGGVKDSGYGRERGEQALDEYTTTKNVMIDFSNDVRDPFVIAVGGSR